MDRYIGSAVGQSRARNGGCIRMLLDCCMMHGEIQIRKEVVRVFIAFRLSSGPNEIATVSKYRLYINLLDVIKFEELIGNSKSDIIQATGFALGVFVIKFHLSNIR